MRIGIFSFFSGLGLLDLGFESFANVDVLSVSEFSQPFLKAYIFARKGLGIREPEYGFHQQDIRCIFQAKEIAAINARFKQAKKKYDFVGFIGGPPCPDFSVGGKNLGREGENGKLSETYIQLICMIKPDFFLFENVKGLWRTKKHRMFFEELKNKLISSGFCLGERLINSIEYGVPQDRERIILAGFRDEIAFNFFNQVDQTKYLGEHHLHWLKYIECSRNEVFSMPWPKQDKFCEHGELALPKGLNKKLTVQYWFEKNEVNNHPNTSFCFKPREALIRFQTIPEGDVSKKSFKRLHRWRYSPTAAYGHNEVHLHPYMPRRINVAEALAIQSMPKDFVIYDKISLTEMFKMIGNGVPFLAAKGLARMILSNLGVSTPSKF